MLAARFAFISAYGEAFLYVSFITLDLMVIKPGCSDQRRS